MASPQFADGGEDFRVWRVAGNVLNKQSRTADNVWSSTLGTGGGNANPHCKKKKILNVLRNLDCRKKQGSEVHYVQLEESSLSAGDRN